VHSRGCAGDGDVRHGDLPRTHKLIPGDGAGHGPIADGDEEQLGRSSRERQDMFGRFGQIQAGGREGGGGDGKGLGVAVHPPRLAQQYAKGQVNGCVCEVGIGHLQVLFLRGVPDHRVQTSLPLAYAVKRIHVLLRNCQDVPLLTFVGPDCQWKHSQLVIGHLPQFKLSLLPPLPHNSGNALDNPPPPTS